MNQSTKGTNKFLGSAVALLVFAGSCARIAAGDSGWQPLFPQPGPPAGWVVRAWDDVSKPGPEGAQWIVDEEGILHGSEPRGTWLVSETEYGDFILTFEWKLGERGNSGCGIRFPGAGDPAFDGLEIQMVDARYNEGRDGPEALSGALYKAVAPSAQVYKPTEWNQYTITARGPAIQVELNGVTIQNLNLADHVQTIERHDGSAAPALRDRPRKGHIGFQELSRGGGHTMIRNARIKLLE